MNKIQMAHDCALAYIKYGDGKTHYKDVVEFAWQYADAMQAEEEKREDKTRPEVLEEWQPAWNQAPEWANWWAMGADSNCYWFENKPTMWSVTWIPNHPTQINETQPFGYTGNWQDSLRKRPESIKNIDPKEYIDAVLQDIVDPCDHGWTHISKFGAEGDFYICPCGAKSKNARGRK